MVADSCRCLVWIHQVRERKGSITSSCVTERTSPCIPCAQFLAAEAEASAIAALVKAEQLARAPIQQPKAEPLVAAARAQGADQGALVDRNERRAESPHRKAEQKQAEASREPHAPGLVEAAAEAQAEVRASLHSWAWPPLSALIATEWQPTSSTVLQGREGVTAARFTGCCHWS